MSSISHSQVIVIGNVLYQVTNCHVTTDKLLVAQLRHYWKLSVYSLCTQARDQGAQGGRRPLKFFSLPWKNVLDIVWNYWT